MKTWLVMATILAGACARRSGDELTVRIAETEHELTIIGTGPDGAERGKVHLRTGPFDMQEDGRHVDGRQMDVVVMGQTLRHESEGYHRLSLPFQAAPSLGEVNDFLRDPAVRRALDRWGVGFDDSTLPEPGAIAEPITPSSEVAYSACSFTRPCGDSNPCVQSWSWKKVGSYCHPVAEQRVCCGGATGYAGQRRCGYTQEGIGSYNPCGTEGPNGCAPCWTSVPGSCSVWESGVTQKSCQEFTDLLWIASDNIFSSPSP